jgi:hypothetical protein
MLSREASHLMPMLMQFLKLVSHKEKVAAFSSLVKIRSSLSKQ